MAPIPKPERARTKHFFKEWRDHRHLTQEQAMGRLGWSQSKISRIESGKTPYNQDDLEAAADAYGCSTTDLINVNPKLESQIIDLLDLLRSSTPSAQRAAISMLKSLKTGTDGE